MRVPTAFLLLAATCLAIACSSAPPPRTYALQGQVLAVPEDRRAATIKHEEIKGLMAGMTMTFQVKDPRILTGIEPGDLVNGTLVVEENGAYLTEVKKVGQAPLPQPTPPPSASSGFELLKPGESLPESEFVDQEGRTRTFSSFRGSPLAITFIYTACPLPDFCPLMDRHFVTVQKALGSDPALKDAHLVSVSFDPVTDTPAVLKKHASGLGADLSRWTFLTGERDEIDRFAARFGLSLQRAPDDPVDITHNLRTAIVDGDGKLAKVYTGNQWTPQQVVADLKAVAR
jgi:protein SCO1/2